MFYSGAFYFVWGLHTQVYFNHVFLLIGVFSAGVVLFLSKRWPKTSSTHQQPYLRSFPLYCAPVIAIFAVSSYMLGRYPFFVSDDFGHLTIINRMVQADSLGTPFLYMPDDALYFSFFPWNGILASFARMLGHGALDVFTAAKTFLTVIIILSFMSFCKTLFRDEPRAILYILCCSIVYALLAPEVFIFHGVGDYRGISYVFMLQAARILWNAVVFQRAQNRNLFYFVLLMLGVSLIHPIDLPAFLLMFYPYLLFITVSRKEKKGFLTLVILGAATGAIGLAVKFAFYSSTTLLLNYVVETEAFWKYYIGRLDYEFGIRLTLVTLFGSVIVGYKNRRSPILLWWPVGALVASFGLGSANPLLAGFYSKVMSADLMERTMYAFPLAVPLGSVIADLSIQISTSLRRRIFSFSVLFMLIILGAMVQHAWTRYGMNGDPSYAWPSAQYALLSTQPELFKYLAKIEKKIILTDMLTSAPITAVSSNFTYTNRPWVELKKSRIQEALTMMQMVGNGDLTRSFCRNGIHILVLNPEPPFARHPAYIFDDYYRMYKRSPKLEKHLTYEVTLNGASIYFFDRKLACP